MKFDNVCQYRYEITKNGECIDERDIDDPFLVTTIVDQASAWDCIKMAFRGGFHNTFRVRVSGTPVAHRVVFTSDYSPPEQIEGGSASTHAEPEEK